MGKEENLKRIIDCGVVSIIRVKSQEEAIKTVRAIKEGGIDVIEVSVVTPGALKVIKRASEKFGDEVLIGVGTILDPETARASILSGAEFVIGPTLSRGVISVCRRYSKISIPGAFTPTEILTAWELGADVVKVFPAAIVGPSYLRAVLGPLPQVRVLPTGGVNLKNAGEFIKAGSVAIAVGGALVDEKAVMEGRFEVITENARRFLEAVKKARGK